MKLRTPICIVLHHAVTNEQPEEDVWKMICGLGIKDRGVPDYHFGVGASGKIYTGCPIDTVAAHCGLDDGDYSPSGVTNQNSLAICAIGNFDKNNMKEAQINGIAQCIINLKKKYPKLFIKLHRELTATACPGRYYPFQKILTKAKEEKMEIRIQTNSDAEYAIVDGQKVDMKMHPIVIRGVTMIPLRFIAETLGCSVTWDPKTKQIIIKKC